jgi:hypothetical protein
MGPGGESTDVMFCLYVCLLAFLVPQESVMLRFLSLVKMGM